MNSSTVFPTCGFKVINGTTASDCNGTLLPMYIGKEYAKGNRVYWKCSKCGRQIS